MKKTELLNWLKENSLDFLQMSDAEKKQMREILSVCGAATSTSKYTQPCSTPPMKNGRCKKHGGKSLSGIASPQWKTGKYSKFLPTALLEKYSTAISDPDLLSVRNEIAVQDARIMTLMEQLDGQATEADWERLATSWREFLVVQSQGNVRAVGRVANEINRILDEGTENIGLWNKINTAMEMRRRLVQTEARRLAEMNLMVTAERAMAFAYALLDIVRRHLTDYMMKKKKVDKHLLSTISADVRALVSIPEGRRLSIDE